MDLIAKTIEAIKKAGMVAGLIGQVVARSVA